MPANLPPVYFQVEEEFRQAKSVSEKIDLLEEMLRLIPKHKGTDRLRGDLRRKLAKLRERPKSGKSGRRESAFHIEREGAGQIVLVGPPNVGKSALVAALTHADPEVSSQPFSTWTPSPGMMPIDDIQVQLVDTPPINPEYVDNELLNLVRSTDMLLLVIDIQSYPLQQFDESLAFLAEHRIIPLRQRETYEGERRAFFLPTLVAVNKNDDETTDEDVAVLAELLGDEWTLLPVSATTGRGIERFKQTIFRRLGVIRVYCKPPGKELDLSAPFVLKQGSTVHEFAGKVHKDFVEGLQSARVWGAAVYDGQMVGRDYILHDRDIVELRM
jgi:hypothetical protein